MSRKTKLTSRWLAVIVILASLTLVSCLKDGDNTLVIPLPDGKIPYSVIPSDLQDSLISNGFVIHEGITPDTVVGKYLASPLILHYASDNYMNNFYPITITLTEQKQRGMVTYYETQRDTVDGSGIHAQVIGHDSCITIYCHQVVSESRKIQADSMISEGQLDSMILWRCTTATVISGIVTPKGFRNFQYSFVMLDKDTTSPYQHILASPRTFRIYKDGDNMARKIGSVQKNSKIASK